MTLPFNEPSQVLFQLLGMLMQTGKEVGFITEILTGETTGQNVPATSMLALIEQGTRAFKPVVEKLYLSEKTEFELYTDLIVAYDTDEEYKQFHNLEAVTNNLKEYDYDDGRLKIVPIADPSMSSEAHKYAQGQAIFQLLQQGILPNPVEAMKYYMEILQVPNPERFLTPPPGADKPDPKVMKIQADQQRDQMKLEFDQLKLQQDAEMAQMKHQLERMKLMLDSKVADATISKMSVDAEMTGIEARYADDELEIKKRLADAQEDKIDLEYKKLAAQKQKTKSKK